MSAEVATVSGGVSPCPPPRAPPSEDYRPSGHRGLGTAGTKEFPLRKEAQSSGNGSVKCSLPANVIVEGGAREQQQREKGLRRQRLKRSDSDRAILGRIDYDAIKRDLR